jgi:hypothetical protein
MGIPKIILLAINVLGGVAVIWSYIHGFATHPGSGNALWGGVPLSLRSVYGVSMILSALGYFAFLYYIIFCLVPAEVRIANRFGFWLFHIIFLGILIPSAFWMPLTFSMIANQSTGTWIAIRTVLILVGISSCALLWALLSLNTREPSVPYWLAIAGSAWFAFHTAILDMLLWPALFKA